MQRVQATYNVQAMPAYDDSSIRPGYFQDGEPVQGTIGTIVPAAWLNGVQEELVTVIHEAGITLDGNDNTQLLRALKLLMWQSIYPVGAIYISTASTSPAVLFGGTWQVISGRFLIGADSTYPAGKAGGSATHTLTAAEMPSHGHSGSSGYSGEHTHSANSDTAANHTHTRGTMEITGQTGCARDDYAAAPSGAFYFNGGGGYEADNGHWGAHQTSFQASRAWTGATSAAGQHAHKVTVTQGGAHNHTVSVGNTGGGKPHNNMPPYLPVYMWKRTA